MEYCYTGGGGATDYCAYYGNVGMASLVKLNHGEITAIRSARNVGLAAEHTADGYVYYVDGVSNGFRSNLHNPRGTHYISAKTRVMMSMAY
jgi:hypothetical protein